MTSSLQPFRFGVQAPLTHTPGRNQWIEMAKSAESLGYSTLTMPDHFTEQLAPVPALTVAAEATTTLRIGALVCDNDYKHPVVFAKEMATMDALSNGRVQLGLGAGWMLSDYTQSGITFDPPGTRIDRLREALHVIRSTFADGKFSFQGVHYQLRDYEGFPKPVQRPHPPILIGGGGTRLLTLAAREADIVSINGTLTGGVLSLGDTAMTMTAEAVDRKVETVRTAAAAADRTIELSVIPFLIDIRDNAAAAAEQVATASSVPRAVLEESPAALLGPPSKLIEDLIARRERWGFSYIVVSSRELERFAPVVAQLTGR